MFGDALKVLLEQKHLYQKVKVGDPEEYWKKLRSQHPEEKYESQIDSLEMEASINDCHLGTEIYFELGIEGKIYETTILLNNAKMFCPPCEGREPFAAVVFRDLQGLLKDEKRESTLFPPEQVLFLTYECQHCHNHQISLIVYRSGWELSLQGRFPMEQIELPKYIPKREQHLFRDTLIAMHGGKVLAALFYLRTFIEQFARRVTGVTGKETGDVIMERYTATLPLNQRDSMPSLREWYGKLSEALHDAREDERLLEAAIEAIEHHFDIRRVHRIPETPAKA
jgi:hypothetical protein